MKPPHAKLCAGKAGGVNNLLSNMTDLGSKEILAEVAKQIRPY